MTASQPRDIFKPGDVLNNTYRIEAILGRGGTSEVYKARSEISGKIMAVKALRAEFASNEDFLVLMTREEDIRDIQHDAIVRYFDTQRMENGVVYLVMDHIDGPGLDQKLKEGGVPASDLMTIGERVCEGLIAAHARNIVHRDLSPDNIILRNDDPATAVIIDFGIAKDTNPGAETIVGNEFAGKYAYAAPEQLSGTTDARSDIYSLGALLLSTFRGEKPDIGNNPMEVVQKKGEPLDLTGVPAPLGPLIAKMTAPDPADRFQTATDLLAAFQNPDAPVQVSAQPAALDDATVIAPVARAKTEQEPAGKDVARAKERGRGGVFAVLAVAAVALGGAGVYFTGALDGLIGPRLPVADPYTLTFQKGENGILRVSGFVPSPEEEMRLETQIEGFIAETDLTVATGDIPETWTTGVLEIFEAAALLDEFEVDITGIDATVTGLAANREEQQLIASVFDAGFPQGFTGRTDILSGPRVLMPDMLDGTLSEFANCGPMRLLDAPPTGYQLNDTVTVKGRFADADQPAILQSALEEIVGSRNVAVQPEVFNPALCRIDAALPFTRSGGFDVRFGWGDRDGVNESRDYFVGENPTIDVKIPDLVLDGYLRVSIVDVKGLVYHLLPHLGRPENDFESLRAETEDGFLRVAFPVAENASRDRLAFLVDDSVLGMSQIIVLHSTEKLFNDLRPVTESVEGYAEAIESARATGNLSIRSLDTAFLNTVKAE